MSRWAGHDIKFEPHQVGAALSNPKHRSISQQPAIADIQFLEIWSERGDDPDTVIIQPSPSSSPNLESVQKPKNWQFSTRKLISSLQLSKTTRTPLNVISSHWWKRVDVSHGVDNVPHSRESHLWWSDSLRFPCNLNCDIYICDGVRILTSVTLSQAKIPNLINL